MSAPRTKKDNKKKRLGSRRYVATQNEPLEDECNMDSASVAQHHTSEENTESLNVLSKPDKSQFEDQQQLSSRQSENRRRLGSSRINKGRQHVKDPETESYYKPREEVEERTRGNEGLETTHMSLATQFEKQEEVSQEREHDPPAKHDFSLYSTTMSDFSSEIENATVNYPEDVLKMSIPQSKTLQAEDTKCKVVSDSCKAVETVGADKSDTLQSEGAKENAHHDDVSDITSLSLISCPTIDLQVIDRSDLRNITKEVYSDTEIERDAELLPQDGNLHSAYLTSESQVESVIQFSATAKMVSPTQTEALPAEDYFSASLASQFSETSVSAAEHADTISFNPHGDKRRLRDKNSVAASYHKTKEEVAKSVNGNVAFETEKNVLIQTVEQVESTENSLEGMDGEKPDKVPTVYSVIEKESKERDDTDFLREQAVLQAGGFMSKSHVNSENIECPITPEITTEISSSGERKGLECSVEQAMAASKKGLPRSEEENEHLNLSEVRGACHSEDAVNKVHEQELKPTQIQEKHEIDYFFENTIHDIMEMFDNGSGNLQEQAEFKDTQQSELIVQSSSNPYVIQKVSYSDENQAEHLTEENNSEPLDQLNEVYHTYDTHTRDTERVDTGLSQVYEIECQVEDEIKPSAEQSSQQEKEGLISKGEESESLITLESEIHTTFGSQSQDTSVSIEKQHDTDSNPIGNRRKLGSRRRNKGQHQVKESLAESYREHTEEDEANNTVNDVLETQKMELALETKRQEELGETNEHNVIISTTNDSSLSSVSISGSSSDVQDPTTTDSAETDLEGLSNTSENVQEKHYEKEADFKVEAFDESVEVRLEKDESNTIQRDVEWSTNEEKQEHFIQVRGASHSEDAVNKVHEQELKPTQMQEMHETDYMFENTIEDTMENLDTRSGNLKDQAEFKDTQQSDLIVRSSSYVIQKVSYSDKNQAEHLTEENNSEPLDQLNEVYHTYDTHTRDTERVDTGLSQVYEIECQVEDEIKPSAEQSSQQEKEGLLSKGEESESLQNLESEIHTTFGSQSQDTSVSIEKQHDTDSNPIGNRRKLGSRRRNKGPHHFKDSTPESHHTPKEEDIENIRVSEAPEITTASALQAKGLEETTQDDIVMSITDNSSLYSVSMPGHLSEVLNSTRANCPEAGLEGLINTNKKVHETHNEKDTDFEVQAFNESVEDTLGGMDKSDILQSEEVREVIYSGNGLINVHDEDVRPTQIQKMSETDKSSLRNDATENYETNSVTSELKGTHQSETQISDIESLDTVLFQVIEGHQEKKGLWSFGESECSIEQAMYSSIQEELSTNEEQNEHFNLSEVRGAQHSEEVVNKVDEHEVKPKEAQEISQIDYSSESVANNATEDSAILSVDQEGQTEFKDTHQSALSVKSIEDPGNKQEVLNLSKYTNPTVEDNFEALEQMSEDTAECTNHQEKEGLFSEVWESECSLQTPRSEVHACLNPLTQDNSLNAEEQNNTDFKAMGNRRKLGSSRRNKGKHAKNTVTKSYQRPSEVRNTVANESFETTKIASTKEAVNQEISTGTMMKAMDTHTAEDVSDNVEEDAHVGTSDLTRIHDHPSFTVEEQVKSNFIEMHDEDVECPHVSSVTETNDAVLLKQWGILQGKSYESELNLKLEDIKPSVTLEKATDKSSPGEHIKLELPVEQATFPSPKEELSTNEEQTDASLSEVTVAQHTENAGMKVHEEELKTTLMEEMHQINYIPDEEKRLSVQTLQSEVHTPLDSEPQDHSQSIKEEIHTYFKLAAHKRKLGSSRRNKGKQHELDSATETCHKNKDDVTSNTEKDDFFKFSEEVNKEEQKHTEETSNLTPLTGYGMAKVDLTQSPQVIKLDSEIQNIPYHYDNVTSRSPPQFRQENTFKAQTMEALSYDRALLEQEIDVQTTQQSNDMIETVGVVTMKVCSPGAGSSVDVRGPEQDDVGEKCEGPTKEEQRKVNEALETAKISVLETMRKEELSKDIDHDTIMSVTRDSSLYSASMPGYSSEDQNPNTTKHPEAYLEILIDKGETDFKEETLEDKGKSDHLLSEEMGGANNSDKAVNKDVVSLQSSDIEKVETGQSQVNETECQVEDHIKCNAKQADHQEKEGLISIQDNSVRKDEQNNAEFSTIGSRRKLGSSRRNKGQRHVKKSESYQRPTQEVVRNTVCKELYETTTSLTVETANKELSMGTMLEATNALQTEEASDRVEEDAHIGTSELTNFCVNSSSTVDQQVNDQSNFMMTIHDEEHSHLLTDTGDRKPSVTLDKSSPGEHTEPEQAVEQATLSSSKEELSTNEEQNEYLSLSEVTVAEQLESAAKKVHEEDLKTSPMEEMHQMNHSSVEEKKLSVRTLKSEVHTPLDSEPQDHSQSIKEEIHTGFKLAAHRRKLGSSRRNKGKQQELESAENTWGDEASAETQVSVATEITMPEELKQRTNPGVKTTEKIKSINDGETTKKITEEKIYAEETANITPLTGYGMAKVDSEVSVCKSDSASNHHDNVISIFDIEALSCEKTLLEHDTDVDVSKKSGVFTAVDVQQDVQEKTHLDSTGPLEGTSKQKRRKMGSSRKVQLNRKQDGEMDDKDDTKHRNVDTDTDEAKAVEESQKGKAQPSLSNEYQKQQETDDISSVCDEGQKLGSTTSDLHIVESNVTLATDHLMCPDQSASHSEDVIPITFVQQDDAKYSEKNVGVEPPQPNEFSSTEMQITSVVTGRKRRSANELLLPHTEDAINPECSTFCETAQSSRTDEQGPEDINMTQDHVLKSAGAPGVVVADLEKEKSIIIHKTAQASEGEEAHNASFDMKDASPNFNSTNRRRKMGSTRRNLGSQLKREDLNQKQEMDIEMPQTVGDNVDVLSENASETKELHTHKEHQDSEQRKEKERVEDSHVSKSPLKPLTQLTGEINPVSISHVAETESHVSPDLPAKLSTSPKQDDMSESLYEGRRRKLGSHRKSRGNPNAAREDRITEAEKGQDLGSLTEESGIKTTGEYSEESLVLDKTSEIGERDKTPLSNISSSKIEEASRPVSEKAPKQVTPHAEIHLGQESHKNLSLVGDSTGADVKSNGYNVLMVGDTSVGKTSFMKRAQSGKFSLDLPASVGLDSCKWTVVVDGKPVVLYLWDTAGQERFHSITRQIFHKAQAFVLMYDITSSKSFSAVSYWANCIQEGAGENVTILLLGNKSDRTERQIKTQQGEILAKEYNFEFMECSAATGENVIECLETMARILSQKADTKQEAVVLNQEPQQKKRSGCC
uniref:Transforming acidic coiled-coil-containing protein C-terminal domain-containing protein n=1 Tax=Anabas testudineus TaxID=64144 RepID=A0AAQ6IRN6_ANATE